MADRI